MDNSFRFFENRDCEYYPCHKDVDDLNCLFCFCPFYFWEECPGRNEHIIKPDGRRIKNCSKCSFPHFPENRDRIMEILKMGQDAYYKSKHPLECNFYGIGIGPGEASLLTKKAMDVIKAVDVVLLPAKDKESCRAYNIAVKAVPSIAAKECIFYPFPMTMKDEDLKTFHRQVADKVEEFLIKGKSVGFLTIGDVSIYSTFAYVEELVSEDGYGTEYICGIPSFIAAASRLNTYLTLGDEEMHIIPGRADIEEALNLKGTLIFMKSGKKLAALREKLLEAEKQRKIKIMAVSNCGMDNEIISEGADNITDKNGYLTVVIVKNY